MSAHQRSDSTGCVAGLEYAYVFIGIEFPVTEDDAGDNVRARTVAADGDCFPFEVVGSVNRLAHDKERLQTVDHDRYNFDVGGAGNTQV